MEEGEKSSPHGESVPLEDEHSGTCQTGLSEEEFKRLQNQLLQLRAQNYSLEEQNAKLGLERNTMLEKIRVTEEELQKTTKSSLFRRRGQKDADALEEEIRGLRQRLATQEEEFRLQQATLMQELNKVVTRSDEMEKELTGKNVDNAFDSDGISATPNETLAQLRAENIQLRNQVADLSKIQELAAAESREQLRLAQEGAAHSISGGIEELAEAQSEIVSLKEHLEVMKGLETKCKELENNLEALKGSLKAESDEKARVVSDLKQEMAALTEKFRRKQESYVQLNGEKERQYQEFKKSLDSVVQKKDDEISAVISEVQSLKQELKKVDQLKEKEQLWAGEKASLEQQILSFRADMSSLRDQNEAFQIQIQETHSANDCLSAQLQGAKDEVLGMQAQVEKAEENASKRKQLVDEMASHLEKLKDEKERAAKEAQFSHNEALQSLSEKLRLAQEANSYLEGMRESISELQSEISTLQTEKQLICSEKSRLEEEYRQFQLDMQVQLSDEKHAAQQQLSDAQSCSQSKISELQNALNEARKDKTICMESIGRLKQEGKDKDEQLKVVEKKQQAVMKDLKRQVAIEKKRADRLQEKLQEVLNEINSTRAKSPGFEEVKAADFLDAKRSHNDSGSISGWSMLSGNQKTETDPQSNHADNENDSNSSITMLESDNQDLISRLTQLQKAKFELEEQVSMLEESSGAMAEDLVNKSAIIEQYVKEKPGMIVAPGSPTMDKLPGGLKKVIDFVKIDLSSGDIRGMNRRLQLMLEETLTKNMHLQKDLEIMSQEVSRLNELHPQEKIRKL